MKKILFLPIVLLVMGCVGVVEEERMSVNYHMQNSTPHSIRLKIRYDIEKEILPYYYNNNIGTGGYGRSYRNYGGLAATRDAFGDSVVVIFNNERRLVYTYDETTNTFSAPIDRNMIHPDNYEVLKDERWHKEFSYTITEADYNLATPCNGNCD